MHPLTSALAKSRPQFDTRPQACAHPSAPHLLSHRRSPAPRRPRRRHASADQPAFVFRFPFARLRPFVRVDARCIAARDVERFDPFDRWIHMVSFKRALAAHGATSLFVLLWSSGAIFAELGLRHASAFVFLTARFALASLVLLGLACMRGRWLPPRGERRVAALTGLLMMGGYSIFYLLALERGIAPGVLATILGVQPILTLAIVERRWQPMRVAGLGLSLAGLVLVVCRGVDGAGLSIAGVACALAALVALTVGSLQQKRVRTAPADVLPLQNAIGLALCAVILPFRPISLDASWAFVVPLLWLGIVISVIAQFLFYRLMQRGDLVNVTSLFYLVPIVTTLMDAAWLGNRPEPLALAGMGAIVAGLALVFRTPAVRARPDRA